MQTVVRTRRALRKYEADGGARRDAIIKFVSSLSEHEAAIVAGKLRPHPKAAESSFVNTRGSGGGTVRCNI